MAHGHTIEQYVAHYYRKATYVETYKTQISQVPIKMQWRLPADFKDTKVLPNLWIRLPGRPKEGRIPGGGERGHGHGCGRRAHRRGHRCRHCGLTGHKSENCPNIAE